MKRKIQATVRVTQVVETLSNDDDVHDQPAGDYTLIALFEQTKPLDEEGETNETETDTAILDEFHSTIAIGCLDDFEIEIIHREFIDE